MSERSPQCFGVFFLKKGWVFVFCCCSVVCSLVYNKLVLVVWRGCLKVFGGVTLAVLRVFLPESVVHLVNNPQKPFKRDYAKLAIPKTAMSSLNGF